MAKGNVKCLVGHCTVVVAVLACRWFGVEWTKEHKKQGVFVGTSEFQQIK
jgi:hypothetical protein